MKLQTTLILILAVTLLFTLGGALVQEFDTYYPINVTTSDIDPTTGRTKYDYTTPINQSFTDIAGDLERMQDESGWERILSGLSVFAKGTLGLAIMVVTSPFYIISIISGIAFDLAAPPVITGAVIPLLLIMIIGAVIVMIVKFIHRSSPGV